MPAPFAFCGEHFWVYPACFGMVFNPTIGVER